MKKPPDKASIPSLRDAYKVGGFGVRARIDICDGLEQPSFVIALDRRSKKHCAVAAGRFAAALTASAGAACAISAAGIEKFISIFTCAASSARAAV